MNNAQIAIAQNTNISHNNTTHNNTTHTADVHFADAWLYGTFPAATVATAPIPGALMLPEGPRPVRQQAEKTVTTSLQFDTMPGESMLDRLGKWLFGPRWGW